MDNRDGRIYSDEKLKEIFKNIHPDQRKHFTEMLVPPTKQQLERQPPKVERNDPCPCGSGKKFKHCHLGRVNELIGWNDQQVGAEKMRKIGQLLKEQLPGLGFALFTFEFNKPGMSNYISNASRDDMIIALEETVARFKQQQDFKTPEEN